MQPPWAIIGAQLGTVRIVAIGADDPGAQCHMRVKFDVAEHHHHSPGGAGAQRVNCHMPTKTYMVVDVRREENRR